MSAKPIRLAHLSDMHVEPDPPDAPEPTRRHAAEGFRDALTSLQRLTPAPDLVVTGGDHIMDGLERPLDDVLRQWQLYQRVLREHCNFPVHPVIGNHDVFGWMTDAVTPDTPGYGKALACEMLGLGRTYYSLDLGPDEGGWRLLVLDNTQPGERGYFGGLDATQEHWLERHLATTPPSRHLAVISHIPILSVCAQHFFSAEQPVDFWKIHDVFVHRDARQLVEHLARHRVRLCLSAHIHMLERIEFRGITFICDGSVSGNWWRGPFRGFEPGYGVIDLYPDGSFRHEYLTYARSHAPSTAQGTSSTRQPADVHAFTSP